MVQQNRDSNKSSTTFRAFRVLEAVAQSVDPISATEVAAFIDADKSTAYRMLSTLVDTGYIIRDEPSKRYRLSYKVISLTRNLLADNPISQMIQQAMLSLSSVTHETIHYAVLEGSKTILVSKVKGRQLVSVDFQLGDQARLYCTSVGKAILAFQDDSFIEKIIGEGLPQITQQTITDPMEFRKELQQIRTKGFAIDEREMADDMRCVAVPIFEYGGRVSKGLSISGPITRFSLEKLEELRKPMQKTAREVSEKLGGFPS